MTTTEQSIVQTARKVRAQRRVEKITDPAALLTTELLAARFGLTIRSIDRWQSDPRLNFPKPDLVIFRRKYWRLSTIEGWEAQHAEAAA